MKLEILKGSENYTAQVIKLPAKVPVKGLDNLVSVTHQGNECLIGKDANEDELYLFFPAECKLSDDFLKFNNLYRHSNLNANVGQAGFFEDNQRVKSIKFKGVISTGFIIPMQSAIDAVEKALGKYVNEHELKVGDEFNVIDGLQLCEKYIIKEKKEGMKNPRTKILDSIVESKFVPEHFDTSHLLKNTHKIELDDYIAVTYKLHGCSARYFRTNVIRKHSWLEKLAKWCGAVIQDTEYEYISGSRRTIKSVGFETLPGKNHYYLEGDLWSKIGKDMFDGKLNKGEAVYCEIIGQTYGGSPIQGGYTYGLSGPKVYIYRITNINPDGIEVDLSYHQMKARALQLGIEVCPEFFYGKLWEFIHKHGKTKPVINVEGIANLKAYTLDEVPQMLNEIFYNDLLEKPSILDSSVVEEGFCVRKDGYPKCEVWKIKSKKFLLHEGHQVDLQTANLEEDAVEV
jgi:hypothetical protein